MKKLFFAFAVIVLTICYTNHLNAQPLPEEQGDGTQTAGTPIAAPIDGGAGILLTLGIAYAVSRYKNNLKPE